MTSVEKRHSGHRKHRKHSDGAHSDTSSGGGSFLDETDREVSSLTDRAFRSLCIGDEAVYNDSDLGGGVSSPSVQREMQLAFSQSGSHGWDPETLKRATHERFSLRVQQYGAERMQGGPHGAPQVHGEDPHWDAGCSERTERGVSATFQRSFVDMSQQEDCQGDLEQLSLLNGPMELGSQQHRRSRSRVSSLIKAFSSEGGRDGNLREWSANEASWDKSALMSIQRELSEFSDTCHQNFNSGPFPPPGPFSSRDNNFYSSEMATAAVAHMDSSFTRTSHGVHSAFSLNSNFFMHSEFSPFKLWRDPNRFPFQQGEVTGFMPRSEFPRWYETPMYKELSLGPQPPGPGMYAERGARPQRKTMESVAPPPPPRSTSTSTVLQKAFAVEKRCESELTGQYPPWKQTQGGQATNRLTSQRPQTVSPIGDLSRRVRDTLSSVSKLQQKITMMTSSEQSVSSLEVCAKQQQQGMLNSYDGLIPLSTVERNVASSAASSMTPFNISQLLTPVIPPTYQDTETMDAMSPLGVEHPPVRAESRGATPDVRSSYKSRATSLLFNLKDNRKRVKSTYSPPKFKGPDLVDRGKQHVNQNEPRDTIIDMPDFPDIQIPQVFVQEEPGMADAALQQALQEQCCHVLPPAEYTSQPMMEFSSLSKEYSAREYLVAQMQGDTATHGGFGLPQGNYNDNQLINGLNRQEDLSPFTPFQMGQLDRKEPQAGTVYGQAGSEKLDVYNTLPLATSPLTKHNLSPKPFYSTTDTARSNIDPNSQNRGYVTAKMSAEQNANKSIFTNVDGYEQVKENRYGYNAVSYQDSCKQQTYTTSSQAAESLGVEDKPQPAWKGEISAYLSEKEKQAQSFPSAQEQSWNDGTSYNLHKATTFDAPYQPLHSHNISNHFQQYPPLGNESVLNDQSEAYSNQDPVTAKAKYERYHAQQNEGNEIKNNYPTHNYYPYGKMEQEYRKQHMLYCEDTKNMVMQEKKQHVPKVEENEDLSIQQNDFKHDELRQFPSSAEGRPCDDNVLTITNQIRAEKPKAEQIKVDYCETEPPKTLQAGGVQVGHSSSGSSGAQLNIEGLPGGERHKARDMKAEHAMGGFAQQLKAEDYNLEHVAEKQGEEEQASKGLTVNIQEEMAKEALDEIENKREESKSDREIQQLNSALANPQQMHHASIKQAEDRQADRGFVENTHEVKEVKEIEQSEAEQIGISQVEQEELYGKMKMEQANENKTRNESIDAELLSTTTEQTPTEQVKGQLARAKQAKAEISEIEKMKSESAKPKAKQTDTEQVKLEPTKVEHAKTELAKARAELAKIKEKMRGEPKDQVGRVSIEGGNVTNKSTPGMFGMAENPTYQQNEELIVNSSHSVKSDRGSDYYEHVREKYGWSNRDDSQKTPADKGVEKMNKSKDENNTNKEEQSLCSTEYDEVRENQYVYSESSKEFKLSSTNDLLTDGDGRNNDEFNDTTKDNQAMNDNSEKRDHPDHNTSERRNSGSAKSLPPERKPSSKDTPYRALSYKERAQARQEILTSKIKAHAEKEISAIKEKGLSKNPTKHLASGQASHVRQKPPQLETSKGHDSTHSNIITPKQQMGSSEMRTVPLKSEDTMAVQPPTELKQTESKAKAVDLESKHKWTKVDQHGIESKTQCRTPAHFNTGEEESKHGDNHELQKEGFERKASNKVQSKVNNVELSQAEAVMKDEGNIIETQTMNRAEDENEAIPKDSGPSLKLVLGQSETTTADDDLQIMGIRVTVRERKPSLSDDQVYEDACEGAKNTISAETQPLLFKQGIITRKAKDYTNKNPNESSAKCNSHDAIEAQQHAIKGTVQTSVNKDKANYKMPSKCEQMDVNGTSLLVEKREDSAPSEENHFDENNSMTEKENIHILMGKQDTRTQSGEHSQDEDQLHIDSIAIRVVPRVTEKERPEMTENHPAVKIPPSSMGTVNENKPAALPSPGAKTNTSKDEDRAKTVTPGSNELKPIKDSLEARHTSPSERQGTHSLRFGDEHNAAITTREDKQVRGVTPDKPVTVEATTHARMDEGYFQLQGVTETNQTEVNLSSNVVNMSKRNEEPGVKESEEITISHPESKASITKDHYLGRQLKQDDSFQVSGNRMESEVKYDHTQRQSKFSSRMKTDEDFHVRKHDPESRLNSSTTERQPPNSIHSTRDNTIQDNANYKQKQKSTTTPEISAIADYARLKVIAAEGSPDTVRDFHPGKKEGFFPLIQTRPSRRPVFTSETQSLSVKERMFPKEPEVSAKVSKEPKSVVFSTMEQEHKRTGMFRLGDKENKLPDVKSSEGIAEAQTHNVGLSGRPQRQEETKMKQKEEEHATQVEEERREKLRQERLAAQHEEEIKEKRREAERKAEEGRRAKQREEEMRMKRMMEERKAAEIEAIEAAQREEERRAKERQAIKQREMERKAEEERKAKQREMERKAEEERREKERKAEEERREKQKEMERKAEEERKARERELERRAAEIEEQRKVAEIEAERRAKEKEAIAAKREQERRERLERREEEERKAKQAVEELRRKQIEEERRVAQREEERRAKEREAVAAKIEEERRERQRQAERRAEEEKRAKEMEEQKMAKQREEEERRAAQIEEERRIKQMEEDRISAQIEEERQDRQRKEEMRAAQLAEERKQMEERRRKEEMLTAQRVEEERRRKATQIEEERKERERKAAAQKQAEERAARLAEERRIKQVEEERKAAQIEEERKERQRRAAQREEERRRAAQQEEERRKAAQQEEERRRAAQQEEERRRAAQQEEERRKAAQQEEERRKAAQQEEERKKAAQQEERRKAVQQEEERRKAVQQEEERRKAVQQEEERRKAVQQEEERRRAAQQQEDRRRAALQAEEERRRRAALQAEEERRRRAAQQEEEKRRDALQEEQRKEAQWLAALQEEERNRAAIEEERKKRHRRATQKEEERRRAVQQEEERRRAVQQEEEERRRAVQQEEERSERHRKEERMVAQIQEERRRAAQIEEEERNAEEREEQEKERGVAQGEDKRDKQHAAQRMDVLQYYDINTAEGNSRPPRSPLPSRRRVDPSAMESTEDAGTYSRPRATPSPAPSASRSNASSPALGAKPNMFKVKDNTFRGTSFTRSVKPRFHKTLGEDFRVGSPLDGWRGSQVAEDEQDKARRSAGTPIHDSFTGSGRFSHTRETSSTQDHSAPLLDHRPYNRRSIALDEDDSRSIMSNMSEDVESFATSAADLAELRGIYDYDRPESACSFSSDVSRSLGKPPSVPVKSEKALRRAKRLTQRRMKKELSKTSVEPATPEEKPLHTNSSVPSAATELDSSDYPALSSRHFTAPISLAHAPTQDPSAPSSHSGSQESRPSGRSSHTSPHHSPPVSLPIASPHHSPPVSLPIASPHHSPPVSLPIASPHHSPPVSLPAAPQKHTGRPTPVTQYHVEPGYSQNFPVTQRKVLQDPGSGQYYVVDMPVEVKAKTFFDPETGKYVQLNVRQTAQGGSPPQPRLKQQAQPQQPARPQTASTGKAHTLPQSYLGYPQHHQSSSLPTHRSPSGMSATSTLPGENTGPASRQRQNYGYQEIEQGLDSHQQHNGSPEQTHYIDTACESGKTRTAVYNTHNTEQAMHGQSQINNTTGPRNIITMSELEDFMDVSDW